MTAYNIMYPQKVTAGPGSVKKIRELLLEKGLKRAVLLTDQGVLHSGTADQVTAVLQGLTAGVISEIPSEPKTFEVLKLYEEAAGMQPDCLVAVGGGSVMDTAKIFSVMPFNYDYRKDILDAGKIRAKGLPLISVPTSAGTGAEVTPNAIVVDPERELKVGIVSPFFVSDYVILDPNLTLALPKPVTAATGLDAFCHGIECYISKKANPFSDLYALRALELIGKHLRAAFNDGRDVTAREGMLLAAYYGGLSIASSGTVAVHALSYPLGGKYGIPHGVSNAMLLPHVMEFNRDSVKDRLAEAAKVMGLFETGDTGEQASEKLIREMYGLIADLNIPQNLQEFGIDANDLDYLADSAFQVRRLLDNNPKDMTKDDILKIYEKLL